MLKKNFLNIVIFFIISILIYSCAKPDVVNVVMPGDEKLNCLQLKEAFQETRRFKQQAEDVGNPQTGGNLTRGMFFWPALLKTLHNADTAIRAANDRGYHLIEIMKNIDCQNTDKYIAEITRTTPSLELMRLNRLYKMGVLSKEEFEMAKKKVLTQ